MSFLIILQCYTSKAEGSITKFKSKKEITEKHLNQVGSLIQIRLGVQQPMGNWLNYYGSILDIGLQYSWINKDLFYGISSTYLYGGNVKKLDQILDYLLTESGEIMSNDGSSLSGLQSELRGGQLGIHFGSRISKWSDGNSCPIIWFETGIIQHKRALFSSGGVPQLEPPYSYGLDNLHRGIYIQENIGWMHIGKHAPHFKIELQTFQSITKLIREYQFNMGSNEIAPKWILDFGLGIRTTWILPILHEKRDRKYYY